MTDHAAVIRDALDLIVDHAFANQRKGTAALAALAALGQELQRVTTQRNSLRCRDCKTGAECGLTVAPLCQFAAEAELAEAKRERDEAQLRARINGLGAEPSEAGGPGKEEAYWQRRKLDAAIRHMRDLEDYFRLAGGAEDSPNQIRADRLRDIYEQISDDYLNGKNYRPTMKARAEAAELALDAASARVAELEDWRRGAEEVIADRDEWIKAAADNGAALDAATKKMDACPVCSQDVPGPSWEGRMSYQTAFDMLAKRLGPLNADHPLTVIDDHVDALTAELEDATRQRDAAKALVDIYLKERDEALNDAHLLHHRAEAAELALAEMTKERDKAMAAIQEWRENYQRNDREKYDALALAHAAELALDAATKALREITAPPDGYWLHGNEAKAIARAALANHAK